MWKTQGLPRYFLSGKEPTETPHIIFQLIRGKKGMHRGGSSSETKLSSNVPNYLNLVSCRPASLNMTTRLICERALMDSLMTGQRQMNYWKCWNIKKLNLIWAYRSTIKSFCLNASLSSWFPSALTHFCGREVKKVKETIGISRFHHFNRAPLTLLLSVNTCESALITLTCKHTHIHIKSTGCSHAGGGGFLT